uniref:Uncharacterized protein n=1 Tax=Arion vulgaris TaxID=1028688 RepID=A0A0B7B8Z3_9EUPU
MCRFNKYAVADTSPQNGHARSSDTLAVAERLTWLGIGSFEFLEVEAYGPKWLPLCSPSEMKGNAKSKCQPQYGNCMIWLIK